MPIRFPGSSDSGRCWFLARAGDRFKVDVGPDLAAHRGFRVGCLGSVRPRGPVRCCWAGVAPLVWYYSTAGWAARRPESTYTGYLVLMSLVWGLLFVASLGGVYFPIMLLTRLARGGRPATRGCRAASSLSSALPVADDGRRWLLPLWPMLAFAGVVLAGRRGGLNYSTSRPGRLSSSGVRRGPAKSGRSRCGGYCWQSRR